jgi:IS5 family transposase
MRKKIAEQRPLIPALSHHKRAKELAEVSRVLDGLPELLELVLADLTAGVDSKRGRAGLTAEQVLRLVVLKQITGLSYDLLTFHLEDSQNFRVFCRLGYGDRAKRSAIHGNVQRVRAATLEKINRALLGKAKSEGIEDGQKTRVDTTVVETNIHEPSDSWLLWDAVRVLARTMGEAAEAFRTKFVDRNRDAKHLYIGVVHAASAEERVPLYRKLVELTETTLADAERVVRELRAVASTRAKLARKLALKLARKIEETVELGRKIVHQTRRRVLEEKKVPSAEKVVSIFEPHTAIIVKDRRETYFGHKVSLTTGASGLVLDCVVEQGNPADATLAVGLIERQKQIYGRAPAQVVFDGGFASRANLEAIKAGGSKDVVFTKGQGLKIADMVRGGSERLYRSLRNFRAGIEAGISHLKRSFGLDRCPRHGLEGFKAHAWAAVLAANMLAIARCHLRPARA